MTEATIIYLFVCAFFPHLSNSNLSRSPINFQFSDKVFIFSNAYRFWCFYNIHPMRKYVTIPDWLVCISHYYSFQISFTRVNYNFSSSFLILIIFHKLITKTSSWIQKLNITQFSNNMVYSSRKKNQSFRKHITKLNGAYLLVFFCSVCRGILWMCIHNMKW